MGHLELPRKCPGTPILGDRLRQSCVGQFESDTAFFGVLARMLSIPDHYPSRISGPGVAALLESGNSGDHPESTVNSLGQAIEICISWQEVCSKRDPSRGPKLADAVQAA